MADDACREKSLEAIRLCEKGRYEEALQAFRGVLETQQAKWGPDHSDALTTRCHIGRLLYLQGRTDEALEVSQQVYREYQRRGKAEDEGAVVVRNNMAAMLVDKHQYEEALRILREVLEINERRGCEISEIRTNVAGVLHKLGRHQEALDGYSEAYAALEDKERPDALVLRNNMALLFADMGKFERAREIFEETHEVKRRTLGPKHPSTLITRDNMAHMSSKQGRLDEALAIFGEVYRHRAEVLGPENPDTVSTRNEMASILRKTGKLEEALRIYEDMRDRGARFEGIRFGGESSSSRSASDVLSEYITLQGNIAAVLMDLGRLEESSDAFRQVFRGTVDALGPDHESTLDAWENLATSLMEQGKYAEALENLRKVREKKTEVLGAEHPSVLLAKTKLAELLSIMGNHDEAADVTREVNRCRQKESPELAETLLVEETVERLRNSGKYSEALEMLYAQLERQEKSGSDTKKTRTSLVYFLQKSGNSVEALRICEELYEEKKKLLGPDDPDALNDLNTIGSILTCLDRPKEGLDILNELHEKLLKRLGREHLDTLTTRHNMAAALSKLGRHAEALDVYWEVLDVQQKILPNSSDFVVTKIKIADELETLGRLDEASRLLAEVYETQSSDPLHPDALTTRHSMASVFQKKGDHGKALEILRDVIEKRSRVLGPENNKTLMARNDLATLHLERGELEEALGIFEEIHEISKRSSAERQQDGGRRRRLEHPILLASRNNAAVVYCKLGRLEQALEVFREVYEHKRETLGPDAAGCLNVQHSVAATLAYMKRYGDALPVYWDVHRRAAGSLGPSHPLTLQSLKSMEDIKSLLTDDNLFAAAIGRDADRVKEWIASGRDVDLLDVTSGTSPLHVAAANGDVQITGMLLAEGAPFDVRNVAGETPSSLAQGTACQNLFADVQEVFDAARNRDVDVLRRCLSRNPPIAGARDVAGRTLLHWACSSCSIGNSDDDGAEVVRLLLREGVDPTLKTAKGRNTTLHLACSRRRSDIVEELVGHVKERSAGQLADFVNGKTSGKGTTPLHVAAKNGDVATFRLLVRNGADPEARDVDGQRPADLTPVHLLEDFLSNMVLEKRCD